MKFVAITLLAFVAVALAGPVKVSDNNVGDIVTVGVNANAKLSNKIDQNIISVIVALLNSQGVSVGSANEEPQKLPQITPEMIEQVKGFLNKQ